MDIMHSVNNHNRTRVGTTVVPTHSRPCFRRGKLVLAEEGSGNPGKHWIPPYQVRGRLSQARNDNPVNICVMYKKNFVMKNQSGAALVIALVMMTVLTLIGLASILTSVFEMKISGNKRGSTNAFYSSESGIQAVTTDIQNFDPPTKSYPYYPYSDTNNKTTPNPGAANVTITYNASMVGAPRGVGVSATNFGFAHFGITSKGRDLTDVSTNPSGCQLEERVVRLIPTQEGGY